MAASPSPSSSLRTLALAAALLALLADGQRDLARETLTQAIALPNREKHDDEAKRRARAALAKLQP